MSTEVELLRGLLSEDEGGESFLEGPERAALEAAIAALEAAEARAVAPPVARTVGERRVEFVVYGRPIAQGSKVPGRTKSGQMFVREDNDKHLRPWRKAISAEAKKHTVGWARQSPLAVSLTFMLPGTKKDPTGWCPVAPDVDKLSRAVLDALTGPLFVDDAQVVYLSASKQRGATPGVKVVVRDML